jgi:hypothetical protein
MFRFNLLVTAVLFYHSYSRMSDATGSTASSSTSAFAAASGPVDRDGDVTSNNSKQSEIPQLPAADPDSKLPSIQLGETIKFEDMGPVIINTDGTTRRIDNWDNLTEREKEVTWRRISKRNEERRKMLLQKMQEEEGQAGVPPTETKEL